MNTAIEVKNVYKSFQLADSTVEVLKNVNLEVEPGEFISIMGPSGSGKSTLLYLMGGLDKVSQGCIRVTAWKWSSSAMLKKAGCAGPASGLSSRRTT
jgi:putative ABC transport system ATP-binding protein